MVERLFLAVPQGCLRFVIVVFPDHTHLQFSQNLSKFYRRYYDLISKFQVGLKSLLRQGLLEPDFYGDLVYKLKKVVGSNNLSAFYLNNFPL